MTDSTVNSADQTAGSTSNAGGANTDSKVVFSAEQQAKIEEIKIQERAALLKQHKEDLDKAKKYDDLVKSQNDQKLKETQDLEVLRKEVGDLTPFKEKAESYQQKVKAIVDARIALIPPDKQTLIPKYNDPFETLEYLETNSKLLFGTEPILNHPAAGGRPASGNLDPKLKEAQDMVLSGYPNIDLNSEHGKKKIADTLKILERVK